MKKRIVIPFNVGNPNDIKHIHVWEEVLSFYKIRYKIGFIGYSHNVAQLTCWMKEKTMENVIVPSFRETKKLRIG